MSENRSYPRDVPPMWFAISIIAMLVLHHWVPIAQCPWYQRGWIGYAVIAAGFILGLSGAVRFRRRGTPLRPFKPSTALVIEGPYRFTRNPMYLGMAIVLIGIWIRLGSVTPGIVVLLFISVIDRRFIAREEEMLTERFGEKYADFAKRVRRWI